MDISFVIESISKKKIRTQNQLSAHINESNKKEFVAAMIDEVREPNYWGINGLRLLSLFWNDDIRTMYQRKIALLVNTPVLGWHRQCCALVLDDLYCVHENNSHTLDLLEHLVKQAPSQETVVAASRLSVEHRTRCRKAIEHTTQHGENGGAFSYRLIEQWLKTIDTALFPFRIVSKVEVLAINITSISPAIRDRARQKFAVLCEQVDSKADLLTEWTSPPVDASQAIEVVRILRTDKQCSVELELFRSLTELSREYVVAKVLQGVHTLKTNWLKFAGAVCYDDAVDAINYRVTQSLNYDPSAVKEETELQLLFLLDGRNGIF
jgi:hypothetical protein